MCVFKKMMLPVSDCGYSYTHIIGQQSWPRNNIVSNRVAACPQDFWKLSQSILGVSWDCLPSSAGQNQKKSELELELTINYLKAHI
jgi:hypothetical protein